MQLSQARDNLQRKGRTATQLRTEGQIKKSKDSRHQEQVNKGFVSRTRRVNKRRKKKDNVSEHKWRSRYALEQIPSPKIFSTVIDTNITSFQSDRIQPAKSLSENNSSSALTAHSRSTSFKGPKKRYSSERKIYSGIIKETQNGKSRANATRRTHAMQTRSESLRLNGIFYQLDHSGKETVSISRLRENML